MPFEASEVYDMSRSLLNDQLGTVFTDEVLQPYLNIALRDLGSLMERSNIPITNSTSAVISLPAETDNIGGNSGISLPEDLVEIQGVYQRQSSDDDFFLITRTDFLPLLDDQPLTSYIPFWSWQEQVIRFIPANSDLEIKINYIKSMVPTIQDEEDEIDIIGALNYLGYRTAALAAMFIGENETRAAVLNNEAEKEWDGMEGVSTKGRQSISTRRRPFKSRNRGGSSLGW